MSAVPVVALEMPVPLTQGANGTRAIPIDGRSKIRIALRELAKFVSATKRGRLVSTPSSGVCVTSRACNGLGDLRQRLARMHRLDVKRVPPTWLNGHRVPTPVLQPAQHRPPVAALEAELGRA
ncbi:MAG: hypothetical protein H6Q90_5539 [Deltaproteobacteria bacterium]|nr:hypothetical protein [Deltaproteobacteria bacterium]